MMNILKKYKKPLIGGILLTTLASSALINLDLGKEEATDTQKEMKVSSVAQGGTKVGLEEDLKSKNNKDEKVKSDIENSPDAVSKDETSAKIDPSKKDTEDAKEEVVKSTQSKKSDNNAGNASAGEKYTVQKGDTLFLIAERANVSTAQLKQMNNLSSDVIYENQVLNIKGTAKNSTTEIANRGSERNEDLYWLSRIIHAEAQGESYEGKVAVGNVIMNRVSSSKFPNTIKGVVFDKQDGYTQFSPVLDGSIYNSPDSESIQAATAVLNGARPVGSALYFLNPRKSTNFWIIQNREYMKTIGLHDFYY